VTPLTNHEFLTTVFGKDADLAYVCAFPGDPNSANNPERWAGRTYRGIDFKNPQTLNTYVTVSVFSKGRRRDPEATAMYVMIVDDVGTKVDQKLWEKLFPIKDFPPTWVFETSRGNYQWGYAIKGGFRGYPLAKFMEQSWKAAVKSIAKGGKDPGVGDLTRYFRLPEGMNGKASAKNWPVKVTHWEPKVLYKPEAFALKVLKVDPQAFQDAQSGAYTAVPVGATPQATPDDDPTGWGAALAKHGLLHHQIKPGVWAMECPFIEEHSTSDPTGFAYIGDGCFHCFHGHCEDRKPDDFRNGLKELHPGLAGDVARVVFSQKPLAPEDLDLTDLAAGVEAVAAKVQARIIQIDAGKLDERYVWLPPFYEWFDTKDRGSLSVQSFDQTYHALQEVIARDYGKWTGKGVMPSPSRSLIKADNIKHSYTKTYSPGHPPVFQKPGSQKWIVNTWVASEYGQHNPAFACTPAEKLDAIDDFTRVVKQVVGPDMLDHFLDWSALVVADPKEKPNYHWLIITSPGMGKDSLSKIINALVGESNSVTVTSSHVSSGFSTWAASKFITVNELSPATAGKKAGIVLFDALKTFMAKPPDEVSINTKFEKPYKAPNTGAYVLFSNHANPIVLDKGERRLVVVDRLKAKNEIEADPVRDWGYMNRELMGNPKALEAVAVFLRERYKAMSDARRKALFSPAPMTKAKSILIEGDTPSEEAFISDFIDEQRAANRQLWTGDELRALYDAEHNRRGNDLKYTNFQQFTKGLFQAGAWKPYSLPKGDEHGRVTLSPGKKRQMVYALYETPELPSGAFMKAPEIIAVFKAQSAATSANVVAFPDHETLDPVAGKEKKK
jgi:hypothetical protein